MFVQKALDERLREVLGDLHIDGGVRRDLALFLAEVLVVVLRELRNVHEILLEERMKIGSNKVWKIGPRLSPDEAQLAICLTLERASAKLCRWMERSKLYFKFKDLQELRDKPARPAEEG